MAVSEDLRSVQAMLSGLQTALPSAHHKTVRLLCENLLSLAEQTEALEELPVSGTLAARPFVPMEVLRVARFATA